MSRKAVVLENIVSEMELDYSRVLKFYERGMYQEAFDDAMKLARLDDTDAQVFLGWLYTTGYIGPANEQEALKWYMAAAKKGSANAQYELGNFFKAKNDYRQAFEWYKCAADNSHLPSIYNLGIFYELGLGVEADKDQAMKYFETAASRGHLFSEKKIALNFIRSKNPLAKLRGILMYPRILACAVWFLLRNRYDDRTYE